MKVKIDERIESNHLLHSNIQAGVNQTCINRLKSHLMTSNKINRMYIQEAMMVYIPDISLLYEICIKECI